MYHILPQIKKAQPDLCKLHNLREDKVNAVKAQNFQLEATIRDNENELRKYVFKKQQIMSIEMSDFVLMYKETVLYIGFLIHQ